MNSELNQSYRPKEAAKLLGIGAATLWRWIKERPDFPQPTRLSARCTVLDGAELRQWLAAQAKTPPSPPVVRREPFDAFAGYEPVKTKQTPYGKATAYAAKSNEGSPPPDVPYTPPKMAPARPDATEAMAIMSRRGDVHVAHRGPIGIASHVRGGA